MDGIQAQVLYNRSLKHKQPLAFRILLRLWTVGGIAFLIWFALFEPWTEGLLANLPAWAILVGTVAVLGVRAIIFVESIAYFYHRFSQHVGWLTRQFAAVRRNQKFHWIHHMIFYPIGTLYKRSTRIRVRFCPLPLWTI